MSIYPIQTAERTELESAVIEIARQLSPDELRVIAGIGSRMIRIGHTKYGPLDLDADRRSWNEEISQEAQDKIFYQECRDIARAQRRKERLDCFKHDEAFARVDAAMGEMVK